MLMSTLNTDAEELVNIRNSSGKVNFFVLLLYLNFIFGTDPNITDHYGIKKMLLCRAVKCMY